VSQKYSVAKVVTDALGITPSIRHLLIEEVDSPWNEKAMIKRKRDHLDVKVTIWNDPAFLLGRMYHIFLYVHDVLDPAFRYDARRAPEETDEAEVRDLYNQIWSIYVDSRIEKMGIENFYDRTVRRNLFIDAAKTFTWEEGRELFDELWARESYSYPEIVDYSYALVRHGEEEEGADCESIELELNRYRKDRRAKNHFKKIASEKFRETASDLLSFAAYQCKDSIVVSTFFGVSFIFHRKVFAEMIPTRDNRLLLTLFDASSNNFRTLTVTEGSDLGAVQGAIADAYKNLILSSGGNP
jgi:hypothetical protein